MFTYRGVEITKEIIGSFMSGGGKPQRITQFRAIIDSGVLMGQQEHHLVASTEEEICDKIDEILGPDKPATHY